MCTCMDTWIVGSVLGPSWPVFDLVTFPLDQTVKFEQTPAVILTYKSTVLPDIPHVTSSYTG